jgi:hypothetical protein
MTPRATPASWRIAILAIAGAVALALAAAVLTGMGPKIALFVGFGILTGAATWLLVDMGMRASVAAPWDTATHVVPAANAFDVAIASWRYRIPSGVRDTHGVDRLRDALVELIDDRLLSHHRVDRQHDPERARAILGADLHGFVNDPGTATSLTDLRLVERLVSRIEQL